MNNKTIIFLLLLSCSSPEDPDFTTTQGMLVFDETGRAKESEINQIVQDMLDIAPGKNNIFKNWMLHLVGDPIKCGVGVSGLCAGITYVDYEIIKVQITILCPVYSAIDHEFTHVVQWYVEKEVDYNHIEPFYWNIDRGLSEVAMAISTNTVCDADVPIPELLPLP